MITHQLNRAAKGDQLQLAVQAAHVGLWDWYVPDDELSWDDQCKALFGCPDAEDVVDLEFCLSLMHADDRRPVNELVRSLINGQEKNSNIEYRVIWPDRSIHWLASRGKGFYDKNGQIIRVMGITMDVTDRKEVNRQKDVFISLISHELRTPLTSIKGNIQLAQRRLKRLLQMTEFHSSDEQAVNNEVKSLLDRAVHQTDVQNRLINDLLDVSRIDANKLELFPSICDLVMLVHETVGDLHSVMPNRRLLFEHPHQSIIRVIVDSDRISQVINNFITNALKYSAPDQPVIVGLTEEKDEVKVWVRDFGPGLTPDEQKRIWQRFYQSPSVPAQGGHRVGLGLGLYICQTLIKRHGGNIGVESQPGQGSTFWFTLPIAC